MNPILECKELCKRYGSVQALDKVDLSVEPGRVVGLLGPNGSGKTTLIKLANGLLTPTAGEILIDGRAPGRESKAMVSYLSDKEYLPDWMSASHRCQRRRRILPGSTLQNERNSMQNSSAGWMMPTARLARAWARGPKGKATNRK